MEDYGRLVSATRLQSAVGRSVRKAIELGRKYFAEKFGARPTVATNFDSFGHSVGLVQILKKCGYDGYLCCRPMSWDKSMVKLPDTEFIVG